MSVDTHAFQGLAAFFLRFKRTDSTIVWFDHTMVVSFLPILILKKLGSRAIIIGLVKDTPFPQKK